MMNNSIWPGPAVSGRSPRAGLPGRRLDEAGERLAVGVELLAVDFAIGADDELLGGHDFVERHRGDSAVRPGASGGDSS